MTRLLIHVEGETEETFVNEVLSWQLYDLGYQLVSARLVGNARQRNRRGGIRGWNTVRKDILNHLREDKGCIATTMVDYYALPCDSGKAWPGRAEAKGLKYEKKALTVEEALAMDITEEMGGGFNQNRFVPFVIMHEFEGLLFSDCQRFAVGISKPELESEFQNIRNSFNSPEEINDSPFTAPSKRILELIPNYQKPILGTLAALEIGFETICQECPHFNHWIGRLKAALS